MPPSPQSHGLQQTAIGLYIHIPFCARKCPYCDFNTYAGLDALFERTVAALCDELASAPDGLRGRDVSSVFVGGGTPTVLTPAQLARLLGSVHDRFDLTDDAEITVEANPGTVDREKFQLLRELGVNRLSIGVQSFQTDELTFLGRIHNVDDVFAAYAAARAAGFDNINLDFIFGLPGQDVAAWEDTLAKAVALDPEHLSLYSLIVEPETPLFRWVQSGRVREPDEDLAGEQYELAMEVLSTAGYTQYEVSNWAKPSSDIAGHRTLGDIAGRRMPQRACRHNLLYWRNSEWYGVGPGAHSHLRQWDDDGRSTSHRWSNVKLVPDYVRKVETGEKLEAFRETVDARSSMGETMMLGLRLVGEGVSFYRFEATHGVTLMDAFGREVMSLSEEKLLSVDADGVRLTPRGLMLGNQVFAAFLPDVEHQ